VTSARPANSTLKSIWCGSVSDMDSSRISSPTTPGRARAPALARGLERDWENALGALAEAEAELELRERQRPRTLTDQERQQLLALGADLGRVWSAPTTTDRDRKQLLRCVIEGVSVDVAREKRRATLTLRWRGGAGR